MKCLFPVDGGWSEWQDWGECSVSCGGGDQSRLRKCDNPSPLHDGKDCIEDGSKDSETRRCNEIKCQGE